MDDLISPQPVQCHSGFEYAERPSALFWQGRRLDIQTIEGQWRGPEGKWFQACTQDGGRFDLFYDELKDQWQVNPVLFVAGKHSFEINSNFV
jgi:hypothetical protein